MELHERITQYILTNAPVKYSELVLAATGKGFTELQVLQALDKVHRNRTLSRTVRAGEVVYTLAPPPPAKPDHGAWGRANYPNTNLMGLPIPFYSSVTDGPTEVYTLETRAFYKQKNEELKRNYDKEKEKIKRVATANRYPQRATVSR